MLNKTTRLFLILNILVFSSCSKGYLMVEKSNSLKENSQSIKKIVCVSPTFEGLIIDRNENIRISNDSEKRQEQMRNAIEKYSKKNNLEIKLVKQENLSVDDIDFFNEHQRLNKAIGLSINNQTMVDEKENGDGMLKQWIKSYSKVKTNFWVQTPELPTDFSYMAEKYGTPYFSIFIVKSIHYPTQEILQWAIFPAAILMEIQSRDITLFYHLIVDVERSEIVFRETRTSFRKPRKRVIDPMIYESFYLLKQ